jgi:hypothetical protein
MKTIAVRRKKLRIDFFSHGKLEMPPWNQGDDGGDDLPGGVTPRELTDEQIAILDQIAVGTYAATIRSALLAAGHDDATIDAMVSEGWLVVWDLLKISKKVLKRLRAWLPKKMADGQLVSISPWAAERLRLELVQEGANDRPRWGKMIDEELLRLGLPQPTTPLPSYARLPTQPDHYEAILFSPFRLPVDLPDKKAVKPEDAVMMQEEIDEATHRPKLDPETGQKIKRTVMVWGAKAKDEDDGLKGGLDGRHDGKIPVDPKIRGKKGGKAR